MNSSLQVKEDTQLEYMTDDTKEDTEAEQTNWIRVYHKGVEAGQVYIVASGYVAATATISVYANCYVYLYYNINSICNSFYANTLYPPPTYAVYKTDPKDAPTSAHNSASVYSAKYAAI